MIYERRKRLLLLVVDELEFGVGKDRAPPPSLENDDQRISLINELHDHGRNRKSTNSLLNGISHLDFFLFNDP